MENIFSVHKTRYELINEDTLHGKTKLYVSRDL